MKDWLDSKAIKYLFFSWIGSVLLQLVPMLQQKEIDWWALGSSSVAALAAIVIRMAQPDVIAPLGILNRNTPVNWPKP